MINRKVIHFHLGESMEQLSKVIYNLSKDNAYQGKLKWSKGKPSGGENTNVALLVQLEHAISHLMTLTHVYDKADEEIKKIPEDIYLKKCMKTIRNIEDDPVSD